MINVLPRGVANFKYCWILLKFVTKQQPVAKRLCDRKITQRVGNESKYVLYLVDSQYFSALVLGGGQIQVL